MSHFQDGDFDSPLYFLQDDSAPRRIDESMVANIKKLLAKMQASVRQPVTNGHPASIAKGDFADESNGKSSPHTGFKVEAAAQPTRETFLSSGGDTSDSNGISSTREKTPPPPPPPPAVLTAPKMVNTGGDGDSAVVKKIEKIEEAKTLAPSPLEETISSVEESIGSRSSIKKQVSRGGITLGTQKLSVDERKKL